MTVGAASFQVKGTTVRKTALICSTALNIAMLTMVMVSDLLLRAQDIPGTNPDSWDVLGSLTFMLNSCALVWFLFTKETAPERAPGQEQAPSRGRDHELVG